MLSEELKLFKLHNQLALDIENTLYVEVTPFANQVVFNVDKSIPVIGDINDIIQYVNRIAMTRNLGFIVIQVLWGGGFKFILTYDNDLYTECIRIRRIAPILFHANYIGMENINPSEKQTLADL